MSDQVIAKHDKINKCVLYCLKLDACVTEDPGL